MKRLAVVALGAACLSAVGLVTSASSAPSHSSKAPIVIGFAGALTGFVNFYDVPVLNGAKLAVQDINSKGGLLGGRLLKIITSDNKSDLNQLSAAALDVIAHGANFVMPSCDYDFGGPAARAANSHGLLAIGCAGGPLYGRQGIGPLTFNTYQANPTMSAIMGDFAYYSKHWKHPYLLCDESLEYSKTTCTYFQDRWTKLAGASSIAGQDTFQNSDASISGQITRLRGTTKADFIVLGSYPPGGASAVRQLRAAGVNLPILAGGAFDGAYWLNAVPNLSNFYYPDPISQWGNPWRSPFIARYTKAFGKVATVTYPLMGYAAVQTLAIGIAKAQSTNGAKVGKALETFRNQPLITGLTTYTSKCHIPVGRTGAIFAVSNNHDVFVQKVTPKGVPKAPC